jgi:hypothetical protein
MMATDKRLLRGEAFLPTLDKVIATGKMPKLLGKG